MNVQRIKSTDDNSDIVIYDKTVYISSVVPFKKGTIYEQTKEVLSQIETLLKSVGSSKNRLLTLTTYLVNDDSFDDMNRAYLEWIPKEFEPSRSTIGNVKFENPNWKVEMSVVACLENITKAQITESYINYIV